MKMSVITPTHNRGRLLTNSLESLMRQQRQPDEIIVVDDGSSDNTKEVIQELQAKYPGIIRYFYRNSTLWVNPSVPLNIGIKQAKHELIIFSLSDMVHIGETLERMEKIHEKHDMIYLIASCLYWVQKDVVVPKELWETPEKIISLPCVKQWTDGHIAKDDEITCIKYMYTSNIASCQKKHLMAVNGFDEAMTKFYGYEDSDITGRLINMGRPSKYAKSEFVVVRDNQIRGIHQYHSRPPNAVVAQAEVHRQIAIKNEFVVKVNLDHEWGILEMQKYCLNVGAGLDIKYNEPNSLWFNLDKYPHQGVQIIRNIETQCLPFGDNMFDLIICNNVLEYIRDMVFVMNELWRVLKPGGTLRIRVPNGIAESGKCPISQRVFHPAGWNYFDAEHPAFQYVRKSEGIRADFRICHVPGPGSEPLCTDLVARKEGDQRSPIYSSDTPALPHTHPSCVKLDVGCGQNKRHDTPGWIGVDQDVTGKADIICNIEKGLPFPEKSVDFIYTSHTLEHIQDLIGLMEEFWRILKPDGLLEIVVPYYQSADAIRHPDHKRLMHEALWMFWDPDNPQDDRNSYHVQARFKTIKNDIIQAGLFSTLRKVG